MKRRAVELRTTRTFESISMSPCQLERTRALVLGGGIIQSGQIQIQMHSVWANICGSQFQVPVNEFTETQTRNLNSSLQVGVLSGGGLYVFAQSHDVKMVMGKYSFTRASIHF